MSSNTCYSLEEDTIKWVDKINVLYPEKYYLTGLGIDETKEKADNKAFQSISKSIKLHIKSDELSSDKYQQTDSGQSKSTFNYSESIQVETESIIENATIVKHGYDTGNEMYYSLAVLRKEKFSKILYSKIEESQGRARTLLDAIGKEESKIIKLGNMFSLEKESGIQQNAYAVLRVVSDNYSIYKPKPNAVEVQKLIEEFLLKEFVFYVGINGEMADEIEMFLKDALTANGYYISTNQTKPDLIVKGDMHIRKLPLRGGRWVTLKWRFDLHFIECKSEKVVLSYSIQDKQKQPSIEMAKERILYHFKKEYVGEILEKFKQKIM